MNKLRIMELAQELASVPDNDTGYAKHYILDDIENELNAKPTMPKVFDEWYKGVIESHGGKNTRKTLAIAFNTLLTVDSSVYDESESSLKGWFVESNSIENLDRISKCIDAIRYGYEVSDDE